MAKYSVGGFVFLIISTIFFLIGGLGYKQDIVQDLGIFFGIILVLIAWLLNERRIVLPPYFFVYMGVVALVGWDIMTRGNSFYSPKFFSLMLGGGFFWLAFFWSVKGRASAIIKTSFYSFLVLLGYLFFAGNLFYEYLIFDKSHFSLSILQPLSLEHKHIGVLWSLVLVALAPILNKNKKLPWYIVFTIVLGLVAIIISYARSAYLGVFVGLLTIYRDKLKGFDLKNVYLKIFLLLTVLMIGMITLYKPIRSFNFYTPAVLSLVRLPFGAGVGRFKEVTSFYSYIYRSTDFITTSSHNLFLELIYGLGWMGFAFLFWFILSCKTILVKNNSGIVFGALFLATSAIFMVDPGYAIPTLYWLWVSFLGLAQGLIKEEQTNDLQRNRKC